jgi:periplasmic protein TonB
MKTKKSLQADLEGKRINRIVMGLSCAGALTLMSFEYRSYSIHYLDYTNTGTTTDLNDTFFEVNIQKPELPKFEKLDKPMPKQISENIIVDKRDLDDKDKDKEVDLNVGITEISGSIGTGTFDEGEKGADIDIDVIDFPEFNPEFPGGMPAFYTFLNKNINYPEKARQNGIEGKVFVQFIVEKDGSITDINVLNDVHHSLEKEAIRVVHKMPNWKPGKQGNKPVRVRFTLPINFELAK